MKNTPSSILTALAAGTVEPYMILDIEFSGGTVRLTTLPYDVTVGGNLYVSDGGLTTLAPPQLTNIADREIYRIKLIDYSNEYKNHFDNNAVGTAVTVRLGIEGNTTDLDVLYKGTIDKPVIETNPEEGSKEAIIECSSPFGALDRTSERLCDSFNQKKINVNDTTFDNVYQNTETISVRWGKRD